jgi:hypothetical protein
MIKLPGRGTAKVGGTICGASVGGGPLSGSGQQSIWGRVNAGFNRAACTFW